MPFLLVISLVGGFLSFFLAWRLSRERRIKAIPIKPEFHIFFKNQRKIALPKTSNFNWFIGGCYATLFYWSLPALIWRYGAKVGIVLIILPVALPFLLISSVTYASNLLVTEPTTMSSVGKLALGFSVGLILRGAIGVHLALKDSTYRKNHLSRNGWVVLGDVEAPTSRKALHAAKNW